jgi:hypothetical protein
MWRRTTGRGRGGLLDFISQLKAKADIDEFQRAITKKKKEKRCLMM